MRYGLFAASLLAAGLLVATSAQAAVGPRIAVVNLQEVIGNSTAGQDANKQLQAIMQKLQGEAKDKQQKLQVLKGQLDKADSKSKDYPALQKNYEDSQNDLQQFVLMGRQDLAAQQQEFLKPIEQELGKVIDEYGKAHHYDIILSQGAAGAVYSAPKYDITKGVTTAFDADWAKQNKTQSSQKKPPSGGK
jgi:outer membrane protein